MKCKLVNENFIENYTRNLLMARGVQFVDLYLNPTPDVVQSPSDFEHIEEGATLYLNKIGENKKVLIVVDSDNDGFTSAAITYQYTKDIAPDTDIDYWLHEGKQHGLSDHIDALMQDGHVYDLIILPDSSSNDLEYHNMLKDIETPCLVLDHHITDIPISDNVVVVNNQLSPKYKNKELTGAGVVYQFCRYIDEIKGTNFADKYLDLAAWGIIGDMGSVLEIENRYIIKTGLAQIQNKFLIELMKKQAYSITGIVSPTWDQLVAAMNPISIAFYIVPLVNATIRVGTMDEKTRLFEAFIDGDKLIPSGKRGAKGTMEKVSIEACRECTNARARQNRIKDAAVDKLEIKIAKHELLDNQVLFIRLDDDDDFPAELNGLIAMQLAARHKRPTIVARCNNEGFIKGSARGLNGSELSDFKQFLMDSGMFEYAQGHANAFGCSLPEKSLSAFHHYANEKLSTIDLNEQFYDVNFVRDPSSPDLAKLVEDLSSYNGIWGQNNAEPLIYIKNINVNKSQFQVMGKSNDTVKVEVNGVTYIKFKAKDLIEQIKDIGGDGSIHMEVVGKANLNNWMGHITPQIFIENCDLRQPQIYDF